MTDLDSEAVKQCIEFMYTGEATPTLETIQTLLHASRFLHLDGLTELCFEKLMGEINLQSCLFIKHLAHTYSCKDLEVAANNFILSNFDSVSGKTSFVDLSKDDIVQFMKSNDIQISTVISLWNATMAWIKYDVENRKEDLHELLQLLRLEEYPEEFIRVTIWKDELIQESDPCKLFVAQAIFKVIMYSNRLDVLNLQSCLFIKNLGRNFSCRKAENIANKFILNNFDDVIFEPGFKYLDKEEVMHLIQSHDVRYCSEVNLWKAVKFWIEHDVVERKNHFPDMLQHVKMEKMPSHFLQNTVRNDDLLKFSDVCKDMLMDALFRQVSNEGKCSIAMIDRSSKVLKSYEPISSQWHDIENVKIGFSFTENPVFIFVIEEYLYMLVKKAMHRISWKEKQSEWVEMSTMHTKREPGATSFTIGRFVYVIDGRSIPVAVNGNAISETKIGRHTKRSGNKSEIYSNSSGECYDSLLNSWTHIPGVPTPRTNGCLAGVDDMIYYIGGKLLASKETNWLGMDSPTNIVEMYDPVSKTWTKAVTIKNARYDCASAVLNKSIYVLGGVGQQGRVNDVEVYDIISKVWTSVGSMTVPRSHFSACVIDGCIYAVGGDYRKDAYDKTIELFDPHKRKWEVVKKLNMKIIDNAAVVINI
ncbi:uncharacterized protein LOC144422022 [Styela clava]